MSCTIIGDGPEKQRWEKLAQEHNVDQQITWLGFIKESEDVYRHMKASRVFVLPSEREGFGIVALEANACGVPVLTLNHPENATRHFVTPNKNGNLFERSAEHLAESILHTLETSKKAWQAECQAAASNFDLGHLVTVLTEAYTS